MSSNRAGIESILEQLEQDSRLNYDKTAKLMSIAVKIDDALVASGMSKQQFAVKVGKQKSVISKWLSGTHNFTAETLVEIERVLDIKLIEDKKVPKQRYELSSKRVSGNIYNSWHDVELPSTIGLALC